MRAFRSASSASSLAIALSACSTAPQFVEQKRSLPDKPAFSRIVTVAKGGEGESCYVAYDRQKNGRLLANKIIVNWEDWYERVRASYSGELKKEGSQP